VVVLTRATTDLRAYERALEEEGIPTYVIGARGYWEHPQVVDVVAYLRALANPREEEALYTVLASPLLGISIDSLVLLAATARARGRDPWWLIREPDGGLDALPTGDRDLLEQFAAWFSSERAVAARLGVEELIDRALARSGYDARMLAMPGGRRRLANVRKLMRLAREHEAAGGRELRGFLELVRGRAGGRGSSGDDRESEAPVEGEALDAVRLMTIHRAKGLEFPIVCVADLGRMPWRRTELIRIGRDGRFGMRLASPGTARALPALDYQVLGDEQLQAEDREERRLFYVALTRAQERLIVSGASNLEKWGTERAPMGWLGPALEAAGVAPRFIRPEDVAAAAPSARAGDRPDQLPAPAAPLAAAAPAPAPGPAVPRLSYSSLAAYRRCGYRFYAERVLGLPEVQRAQADAVTAGAGLAAAERGVIVHALLERLDFRRPARPTAAAIAEAAQRRVDTADAEQIAALVAQFAASELCARLARAGEVRREERFAFALSAGVMITGVLDVLAREAGGRTLVVDYKSDRLGEATPQTVVAARYASQRLLYALAGLRAGTAKVEVAHVFLERPTELVSATFSEADAPVLEAQLAVLASGVLERRFAVTEEPQRAICNGCPAEGGLCSWPLAMTRREAPDRLF
jgi:ATP-dependent exoDNAse (exonuclease V) beta subunit